MGKVASFWLAAAFARAKRAFKLSPGLLLTMVVTAMAGFASASRCAFSASARARASAFTFSISARFCAATASFNALALPASAACLTFTAASAAFFCALSLSVSALRSAGVLADLTSAFVATASALFFAAILPATFAVPLPPAGGVVRPVAPLPAAAAPRPVPAAEGFPEMMLTAMRAASFHPAAVVWMTLRSGRARPVAEVIVMVPSAAMAASVRFAPTVRDPLLPR